VVACTFITYSGGADISRAEPVEALSAPKQSSEPAGSAAYYATAPPPIRPSKFLIIRSTRPSTPRGSVYTFGRTYPGGALSPSPHQHVLALNTKFPRGPGYTVLAYCP